VSTTPATPLCGVADTAAVTASTAPVPPAAQEVPQGAAITAMVEANSKLHLLDMNARTVRLVTLAGATETSFTVGWMIGAPSLAVDGSGDVYLARYPYGLVKYGQDAPGVWSERWTREFNDQIIGVYGTGTGSGFRVGIVRRGIAGSTQYDSLGTFTGASDITGTLFTPTPDGGMLATDGAYVRRYGADGSEQLVFGDARTANDPTATGAPYFFYQQGGAALGPDGTIYVADATRGIHAVTGDGFYKGFVPEYLSGSLTERSSLVPVGDRLYFTAGGRMNTNQSVASMPFADLAAAVARPKPPINVLGFGAGLTTPAEGQYFKPGQTPSVTASFDGWWLRHASRLDLHYRVRDNRQVSGGQTVSPTVIALPSTVAGLNAIPLALPPTRRGAAYEVDARLVDKASGAVVGATCLTYTVAAQEHRLDFSTLPPGADYGGPAPARGVALADVLGTGGFRADVSWSQLLPDPNGPMRFEAYDEAFAAAAAEATARGTAWWVQVGRGDPIERELVQNGTWETRVKELVTHFKGVVPAWEAWNEPNEGGGSGFIGTPQFYVDSVLVPFARAVRSADPGATVIGGSTVGIDTGWWQELIAAGGLDWMDVAAIHPFGGHNRSWEEQGNIDSILALRAALDQAAASAGTAPKPLWNTESGWWSDGPGNFLPHADKAARAILWNRILDIKLWSYLRIESGIAEFGLRWSLIEFAHRVDYVKPSALSTMTAAAKVGGRAFTGMVDTGIPHAFAAGFGPKTGDAGTVIAAWTDDLPVTASVAAPGITSPTAVTVTDMLGATSTLTLTPNEATPLALSGSPVYLSAAAEVSLTVGPTQPFGPNVAAAAAGATAAASSANALNPASSAIDGADNAFDKGDPAGTSTWISAPGDLARTLTIDLAESKRLNRVVVATHSIGSIVTGLRDYNVELKAADGSWSTVREIRNQFHWRHQLIEFPEQVAAAIRITVTDVNFGGFAGGLRGWFWPTDPGSLSDPNSSWYGPAVIYEVEAFESVDALPQPPATPTNLSATAVSSNQIDLNWTASSGATGYKVERSPDGTSGWAQIATPAGTTWSDSNGLSPSTTYSYRVRATNAGGDSAYSNSASATTSAAEPGAFLTQSPQGSWVGTYGADGYALLAWNGGTGDLVSLPSASLTVEQAARHQWSGSTSDVRALQSPDAQSRRATTAYDGTQVRLRLSFPSAYSGNLHVYAVDYDSTSRRQSVTVDDGTPETVAITNPFDQGAWVHAPITVAAGGSVVVTANRTAGDNAVIAGLFLGGTAAQPPPPPSAPTNLAATAMSSSRIDLAWSASSGATGYKVERSADGTSGWAQIATPTGTTHSDTSGLSASTAYFYRVRATNAGGDSGYSNTATATTLAAPAGASLTEAPQGTWVDTYGGDGFALLAWNGGTDLVSLPTASLAVEQAARHQWNTSTTDVRALQSPDAQSRRATTAYDSTQVRLRLTFSAAYSGMLHVYAVDYDSTVRRQSVTVDDGSPETVAIANAFDQGAWVHAPITVSAGGSVVITADRTAGPNAVVAGVFLGGTASEPPPPPPPQAPPAPTDLAAVPVSSSRIDLSWTASSGATGYKVERSPDGASGWAQIAAPTGTTHSDTGLSPSTPYFYRVRATNTGGDSGYSDTATATTLAAPPPEPPMAPTNLSARAVSSSQINLAWTASAGATGYKVERSPNGTSSWTQIATPSGSSFSDTGLSARTTYYYRVRATNAAGDSGYSNVDSARTRR
jgi:hypothetical protein